MLLNAHTATQRSGASAAPEPPERRWTEESRGEDGSGRASAVMRGMLSAAADSIRAAMSPHADRVAISTVTPMHDEEACVEEFVHRVDAALRDLGRPYEIIVVSDGSTDRTEALLETLSTSTSALRAICLSRNMGQCSAIDAGIQESRGDLVVVLDGDLQHLPEEIPLLVRKADEGFDLVSGSRGQRVESLVLRRIPSRIANWLLRSVSGCPVRDMGGFKCLRGDLARSLRLRAGQHRLLPALIWQRGGSVGEVIVSAPPRFAGRSHYGLSRSLDVLLDIVMLWFQNSFKSRPLYLFGRIALVLLAIDAIIMPVLLWQKFVHDVPMGTRPPFLIAIMVFLSALFVLSSGFVLELLSDALNATSGVRPWVVRRRIGRGLDESRTFGSAAAAAAAGSARPRGESVAPVTPRVS